MVNEDKRGQAKGKKIIFAKVLSSMMSIISCYALPQLDAEGSDLTENQPPLIGGTAGLCAGNSRDVSNPPAAVQRTIADFVPTGEKVHCAGFQAFEFEGRQVVLTHVIFGMLMDCPAGCIAKHVCTIVDGETLVPFSHYRIAGQIHPVTKTPEFGTFVKAQYGNGPFRHCLY